MHKIIRTTIGEYLLNGDYNEGGIYVIACYPSIGCIYVGRTVHMKIRINEHLRKIDSNLGRFLRNNMADSVGFRLDIHPNNDSKWRAHYERKLIEYFHPLFNNQYLGEGSLLDKTTTNARVLI